MVVQNPNNWHWVDKNCIYWAKEYFEKKLPALDSTKQGSNIHVVKLSNFDGDCEVNQRKGKIISLYDLKMTVLYEGVDASSGEKYEGSITIPEVAFDTEVDDYQFEIVVYKETVKVGEQFRKEIRSDLIPQMKAVFQQFGKDLLAANAEDIQIPESEVSSVFTKQNLSSSSTVLKSAPKTSSAASANSTTSSNDKPKVTVPLSTLGAQKISTYNSTSLHLEPTFNCRSRDLYETFLDKGRVNVWTRGSLQVVKSTDMGSPKLLENDEFKLFGGNIDCIITALDSSDVNEKIVMKWRMNDWLEGYFSEITLNFKQSDEYNETKIQIIWDKVPVGQEDRCKKNFEEYYIKSIKLTFGFGAIL
ncbi:hypothetical protein ACO0RG_002656 [Hanseniaspora osmophila]|uniref:Hsp90 co-chaperone AHA1 n=1 Tax=Hanseniaspora osmophila TaxID=56408 RepID=A0A1E5R7R0_9ASCO|nr:Hsp90 co-chaperone AHA1 [Hanseniaspora osmophila]